MQVARTLSKVDTVNIASMITVAKVHMLPSDSKDNKAPLLQKSRDCANYEGAGVAHETEIGDN
jgi:hypothetical protein